MSERKNGSVYIIGEKEAVWIFQGLGIKVSLVQSLKEAKDSLEEAVRKRYKFIFITETYAEGLIPQISAIGESELTSGTDICITIIPGISAISEKEKKNLAFERLRRFSERGVGVDLVTQKR